MVMPFEIGCSVYHDEHGHGTLVSIVNEFEVSVDFCECYNELVVQVSQLRKTSELLNSTIHVDSQPVNEAPVNFDHDKSSDDKIIFDRVKIKFWALETLRDKPRQSCKLLSLPTEILKHIGLVIRGKNREKFQSVFNSALGDLKRAKTVEEYIATKNVRVRLLEGWEAYYFKLNHQGAQLGSASQQLPLPVDIPFVPNNEPNNNTEICDLSLIHI